MLCYFCSSDRWVLLCLFPGDQYTFGDFLDNIDRCFFVVGDHSGEQNHPFLRWLEVLSEETVDQGIFVVREALQCIGYCMCWCADRWFGVRRCALRYFVSRAYANLLPVDKREFTEDIEQSDQVTDIAS